MKGITTHRQRSTVNEQCDLRMLGVGKEGHGLDLSPDGVEIGAGLVEVYGLDGYHRRVHGDA